MSGELAEQTELADVGELAGQVTHKFNNFLNSLLLRIALLDTELPELAATKFADVRHQAKQMADLIRQVHQFRRRQEPHAQTTDLNPLVERVAAGVSAERASSGGARAIVIEVVLSSQPALVAGSAVDYQRLCSFLLRNRLSAAGVASGALIFRTTVGQEKVQLTLEDTCSTLPASQITSLFDPDTKAMESAHKLELAACKAMVRRAQGRVAARPRENGGLIIEVEFPSPVHRNGGGRV